MPDNNGASGEKAAATSDAAIAKRSVVSTPGQQGLSPPVAGDQSFFIWIGQIADAISPWGRAPKARDVQLRDFFTKESYLLGALGTLAGRNAAFSWKLEGGEATVKQMQEMLLNSNRGLGWESLITKLSLDLYSQDSGAFAELIRAGDSPSAPCVNVAHLDAGRCYPTGDPDNPVLYMDRLGQWHLLKSYQVVQILETPSAVEMITGPMWNLQYCAVSKVLKAAQVIRSMSTYTDEKLSGRSERAIHLVRGVSAQKIEDAMAQRRSLADAQGLTRYMTPTIVGSHDPTAEVGHDTIELASLPDGFDLETQMKWYISAMALAFNVDYQDFAPLPNGNLGSGKQSEILHMKARGKGPALFQKLIEHLINFNGVLPDNCTFRFDEQDMQEEQETQAIKLSRGQERAARIASTEIDPEAARQMALDDGDITQEIYDALEKRANEQKAKDEADKKAQLDALANQPQSPPNGAQPNGAKPGAGPETGARGGDAQAGSAAPIVSGKERVPPGRTELEGEVTDHVDVILSGVQKRLTGRIRALAKPTAEDNLIADEKAYRPSRLRRVLKTVTARNEKGQQDQVLEEELA